MSAQPKSDRRGMLAKVHIAKKQMALAEADYRAVLVRVTGCSSSGACTDGQLHALLSEFKRLGWREQGTRRASAVPHVRKVYAIWADMRLLLRDGGDAALRSFVGRQTRDPRHPDGVSAPEFLTPEQAAKVIEGLKAWRARLQRKTEP